MYTQYPTGLTGTKQKAIDIVNPEPRTELDAWMLRMENNKAKLWSMMPFRKKIEIKQLGNVNCHGEGRNICEKQGEHSWFNHAQDKMGPAYPPEYTDGRYE